jgi:hypothetical protein
MQRIRKRCPKGWTPYVVDYSQGRSAGKQNVGIGQARQEDSLPLHSGRLRADNTHPRRRDRQPEDQIPVNGEPALACVQRFGSTTDFLGLFRLPEIVVK